MELLEFLKTKHITGGHNQGCTNAINQIFTDFERAKWLYHAMNQAFEETFSEMFNFYLYLSMPKLRVV